MTLIYLAIAWALGIVVGRAFEPSPQALAGLTVIWVAFALGCRRAGKGCELPALALALLLGGWRYLASQPSINPGRLACYNDTGPATVWGYVSAEPSVRNTYTQLELTASEIEQDGVRRRVRGKMVFNVARHSEIEYGDSLLVAGSLETPPVLGEFSYREYLASRGVRSLMRRPQVTQLEGPRGSAVLRGILRFKRRLRATIEAILPGPDAGLLSGILLGLAHTLPADLERAFRVVGLTHIIVVSGHNVGLLSQFVMLLARRVVHRWAALGASLGLIACFTLMVGPSPPVVRAALMGCHLALGQLAGRRTRPLTSLALASLVMTVWNPLLLWSVSFQLSFASTLALILLEPALARRARRWMTGWVGRRRALGWMPVVRDGILTTTAAQLATLPVIWYHFGQVSLVSLPANALVLPLQGGIMGLGLGATALGMLWLPAGKVAGWLVWPLVRYCIVVAEVLAGLPWASAQLPRIRAEVLWALGGLVCAGVFLRRGGRLRAAVGRLLARLRGMKALILVLALGAVAVWAAVLSLPDGKLHVYFLDIGQGDAILLRTPGGRVVLVDGGPDPVLLSSRLGKALPFWQRRVDLVVATHADQDHLGGLMPVPERYDLPCVLEAPRMGEDPLGAHWHELLASAGTQVIPATRGMSVRLGEAVRLDVLHPRANGVPLAEGDANENSVVVRVVAGNCRILLTADIGQQAEGELVGTGQALDATVLKVSHHGSGSSSYPEFLSAVNPQIAVISVGQDNQFGHPAEAVLSRLEAMDCRVFRTDLDGTIEFITDGKRYWVRTSKER